MMKKLIKLLIAVMCVLALTAGVIGCFGDVPGESSGNEPTSNPTESVSESDSASPSESDSLSESTHSHVFTAITIKTQPSKTTYLVGDLFDKTGMVVEGTCECGAVTITDYEIVYADGGTSLKYGDTSVTIRYGELTATVSVTVEKRTVEKPASDETVYTYNGSEQTYNIVASELYTVSGNKQTNAGEYTVTVALKDKEHTSWADNSTDDLTYTFTIAKLNAEVVWTKANEYVYKDTALAAPTAKIVGADGSDIALTVSGGEIMGKGKFTFTASTDNGNYTLTNTACEITVKLYNEITGLKFENIRYGEEPSYDKGELSVVHGTPVFTYATEENGEYVAWAEVTKKVGTYYVKAYVEGTDDYVSAVAYATFEVVKADITATVTVADITCKGTPAPSVSISAGNGAATYSYATEEDGEYGNITDFVAGTYYVKAHIAATENYNECYSAAVSFTVSHDHKWVNGETNDEKKCACGDVSETINTVLDDRQTIDLDISTSGVNGEKTVGLDLSAVGTYKSVTKVAYNGTDISDSASVSVNDFGYAYGEKELTVTVLTSDDAAHTITVPVLLVTKVIKTADDYSNWITIAKACESEENIWGGYFMLGNDISAQTMVTFKRTSVDGKTGFKGTFDGCGYAIDGLNKADNDSTAFISCMTSDGVLKNISFTNAKFSVFYGNFLSSGGKGTIENVYVQYAAITNSDSKGYSGTIYNQSGSTKGIFIDASFAEITSAGSSFRLIGGNSSGHGGIFAICPEGYTVTQARDAKFADHAVMAFASYEKFTSNATTAEVVSGWHNNGFWVVNNGIPAPVKLDIQKIDIGNQDINLDILVENGAAKLNDGAFTAKYPSIGFYFGTVTTVTMGETDLGAEDVTVEGGIVSIKLSKFGYAYGENKTITITDENGKTITMNAKLISKVIKTADDYSNWIKIAKACESDASVWGGYFTLGANIDATGTAMVTFKRSSTDGSNGFKGTFDGNGYAIDGLNKADDDSTAFISCMTSEGVLKNIAFTNAKFSVSNGNFLSSGGKGTIENVYVKYVEISNANSGGYTGTLFNQSGSLKNIFIDASEAVVSESGAKFRILAGSCSGYGGIFAICPASGYTASQAADRGNNYGAVAYFADAAEMQANETTQAKIETWDTAYWNIVDGVPQFIVK